MSELEWKIWAKSNIAKKKMKDLFRNERGDTNIVAIILILVVVVGLAIIFKTQISAMVTKLWTKINGAADKFDPDHL